MALKRLLDLRPCDNCGGALRGGTFHVVRVSLAFIKADAVNQFAGMHQFFGGRASPALVENFAPAAADAILIAGDKDPDLMTELVICEECDLERPCEHNWCVALARAESKHCAVHAAVDCRDVHPQLLAEDEELIDGEFGPCKACRQSYLNKDTKTIAARSTGQCKECRGEGVCDEECSHGHHCDHECDTCAGTGVCQACGGSRYGGVRKKAA